MAKIDPLTASPSAGADLATESTPGETAGPSTRRVEPNAVQRRSRLLLGGVVLLALVALFWPRGDHTPAPGGFLVDAGGRPAPLAERLAAPVTLLHFFASWCPPCLEETPALRRLAKDLASEPRFRVVMVAVQDDVAKAQQLAGSDEVLFDPKWETANRYGTRKLPESYLLVDGKLVRKFDGAVDWDDAQVRGAVQQAIARAR
jgi:cytochrome c biogenesis protein CcmG, thiol:disulfide interchange protein DsbE